jgi:Family of unknown function (DUF5694)
MRIFLTFTLLFLTFISFGQTPKIKVLTLGTFHFAFHNRDIKKTDKKDQIDILDKKYQSEIENIVAQIAEFKPTIIAIERDPASQYKIDSLYMSYLKGSYQLSREEYEQIGFRLGKKLGLGKLFCVNDWGMNYKSIDSLLDNDTIAYKKFEKFFYNNPDTAITRYPKDVFKSKGIKAELQVLNDNSNIQNDLGNYLIGVFKYQTADKDFFGVDFTTGWWFNRNLRIFRNIQKIGTKTTDRILVIYGAGHMNLLNIFFNVSPEYELVKTNDYLK